MLYRLNIRRTLVACISLCIVIAQLLPGIALACEGAGEEANPLFGVTTSLRAGERVRVGAEANFIITNISRRRRITIRDLVRGKSAEFSWPREATQVPACLAKVFEPTETCEITARYGTREAGSFAKVSVEDENRALAEGEMFGE
jgi:hypothetical protein